MKNIMIDLETLGTAQSAVFLSIGACFFNPDNGEIGDTFEVAVDIQSSLDAGRTVSASTLIWWMGQGDEARAAFKKTGVALSDALVQLKNFLLAGPEPTVWGNGATFDVSILEHAYGRGNAPWKFWNVRDVRTVADLAYPNVTKDCVPFTGVHHNALHDAIYQANYISVMHQYLKNS